MSEQIREQISAFLDGELPSTESELLLKRLTRDAELRESFGRYALIGEALRGSARAPLTRGFAERVNRAIDGERAAAGVQAAHGGRRRWWQPVAGAAVAAGVAAVAVLALQQRADAPAMRAASPAIAQNRPAAPQEAISYTVPASMPEGPALMPAARLTNYVFAHSQYSSILGQRNVLSGLLTDADEQPAEVSARPISGPALPAPPAQSPAAP